MNKTSIIAKVTNKPNLKDYTYAILFFLLSSFFALFVIKPVLTIAFSLNREAKDLIRINSLYEKNISQLVEIQTKMEQIRDRMYLLDEAVPINPQMGKLISSIRQAGQDQGILLNTIDIAPLDLKPKQQDIKSVVLTMNISGDFNQANNFIKELVSLKRLATIESVKIIRTEIGTETGRYLKVEMVVHAYYL